METRVSSFSLREKVPKADEGTAESPMFAPSGLRRTLTPTPLPMGEGLYLADSF